MSLYPYAAGPLIETPQSYAYTPFEGAAFLDAWRDARRAVTGTDPLPLAWPDPPPLPERGGRIDTARLLAALSGAEGAPAREWHDWLIRRFELSKRLHRSYRDEGRRAIGDGHVTDLPLYLGLADLLARRAGDGHLPSLNALLKCLDTLCSQADRLDPTETGRLAALIGAEAAAVARIARDRPKTPYTDPVSDPVPRIGQLEGVCLLFADTLRSRAYAQGLLAAGASLPHALVIETPEGASRSGQAPAPAASPVPPGLFAPDLSRPLSATLPQLAHRVETLATGTVNAPEVAARLTATGAGLAVYSGFGGELVGDGLLSAGPPLLHMHAGWLPDYRGSTTLYYSWLEEGACGVSAILLEPGIDEGAVVARRRYPPPPPGCDADHLYDGAIRADLLVRVMAELSRTGALPAATPQASCEGETWYIVHPVLKHLAQLGPQDV